MEHEVHPEVFLKLATDITAAFLARNPIDRTELPALILSIREALTRDISRTHFSATGHLDKHRSGTPVAGANDPVAAKIRAVPAGHPLTLPVPLSETITDDYIICLEDGKPYRSLRRHLMAKYGLTPDDYRRKWGLTSDYPMVAPSYARDRSEVAKRTGLGRTEIKPPPRRYRPSRSS